MGRTRVVIVSLVAGALVGAAAAGGIAEASSSHGSASPSSGGGGSVTTAAVQRTNLASTVQVGGSIGYQGSYTIAAPTGASPEQVAQDQQAVTQAERALAADQTAAADATTADDQMARAAQDNITTAAGALSADQTQQAKDCAGNGASTPTCNQDTQKVSQDQTQYSQAVEALATARNTAVRDRDQNNAKAEADTTQLQAAEANLTAIQATAVNPGTTYTQLPKVGQIITEDQPAYSVSNEPVPLLYGSVAAYRAFQVGMAPGADVGELTHDLLTLGFGAGLTENDAYTAATAVAVERWQSALGLPATGAIRLGEAVFEPGPIRVTTVTPSVGQAVGGGSGGGGGGSVLTATTTTPVVTVALAVTEEYLVKPGDAVTVVLPNGTSTVGGRVETVGDVATCPNGSGSGSGSGPADVSPCASSGGGSNSTPTVTVTISLDSTPPGATLDQAPVNVDVTTDRADNVLAVPVNALLALQGGGYAVEVVSGTTTRLVGVTTGLYSNTLVQISGAGVTAGTRVEVPSS